MAWIDDEMPLIDLSDEPAITSSLSSVTQAEVLGLHFEQSDGDGSVSSDGDDVAIAADPSPEVLKREAQKRVFLGCVNKEQDDDVAKSAAEMGLLNCDDFQPEQQRIIEKAREYQQELFERAKEENVIAV